MSLTPIESVQLNTYFETGNFSGGAWHEFRGPLSVPPLLGLMYYDRLDALIIPGQQKGPTLSGLLQFDPLFLDNTGSIAKFAVNSQDILILGIGEWDKQNGVQKIYGGVDPPAEIWPVDQSTLIITDIGSSLFPFGWTGTDFGTGPIGGWDEGAGDNAASETIFFETWGYALRLARTRHTDGNQYRGLTLVDLSDGSGQLLDVPLVFSAAPEALFESFEFNGDVFNLDGLQFVADDDSLPASPKGRVFFCSAAFLSDLGNVDNTDWRQYMKIIEWNPLGKAALPGNSSRVHLREVLFTKLNFIERQAFGTNPNSLGTKITSGVPTANGALRSRFHPSTRTFITVNEHADTEEEERGFVRTTLAPALAEVQPPTNLQEVETAKTVRWRSRALGDLGDPVGGIDADWTSERRSTIDEPFDTSSGIETTVTVAHPPIDAGTLVFKKDGVPLTITTDYTVVEATGVITGVGAHTPFLTSGYTATYEHKTVTGVTPSHGTLVTLSSRTDELGIAETRIQYPDDADLDLAKDYVDVTMSDD